MPTLREDLQADLDDARQDIADLGLRQRAVSVRTVTAAATGLAALTALPTYSDLELEPTPRVTGSQDRISRAGGTYEQGDLLVDKISATYTEAQLNPGGASVWIVDGDEYRLVNLAGPERGSQWEWSALLRRTRHAGAYDEG